MYKCNYHLPLTIKSLKENFLKLLTQTGARAKAMKEQIATKFPT